MEFELDMNGAAPSLNEVKLYQGVKKQNSEALDDEYHIPVGQDHLFEDTEDSNAYFVVLAKDIKGKYVVRFGKG